MSLTIRTATVADISAVRATLIETWHATYDPIYGVEKVIDITTRWHSVDALTAQLTQPHSAFLLAEAAGCVVASSFAHRVDPDSVHLSRLYVHPSAQNRGVGRRLMAETLAPFTPIRTQRLEVEPRNTGAIAFYEREGFRLSGQTGDCGGASGVAALIYERILS